MAFKMWKICTKKAGKKDGDKTFWPGVGMLFARENDKGEEEYSIELNMFPNERFYCFKQEPKNKVSDNPPF